MHILLVLLFLRELGFGIIKLGQLFGIIKLIFIIKILNCNFFLKYGLILDHITNEIYLKIGNIIFI